MRERQLKLHPTHLGLTQSRKMQCPISLGGNSEKQLHVQCWIEYIDKRRAITELTYAMCVCERERVSVCVCVCCVRVARPVCVAELTSPCDVKHESLGGTGFIMHQLWWLCRAIWLHSTGEGELSS